MLDGFAGSPSPRPARFSSPVPKTAVSNSGTPVWSVTVDSTAMYVAASGADEYVRLFAFDDGHLLDEQAVHRDWVRDVCFAPHVPLLASVSGDRSAALWDVTEGHLRLVKRKDGFHSRPRAVTFDRRTSSAVVATEDAVIHQLLDTGRPAQTRMPAGVDWIRSISGTEDGPIVAGCEDGGIRVWGSQRSPEPPRTLAAGVNTTWSTAFSPDGSRRLIGDGNGRIETVDTQTGELGCILNAGPGRVWSIAAGGDHIAAACGDGAVRAWSLAEESWTTTLNQSSDRTWCVDVSTNGQRITAATAPGLIRCWEARSGDMVWERPSHAGRVRSITSDASGRALVVCGGDGTIQLWDASSGEHVSRFTNPAGWARSITTDPTGHHVAIGAGNGDIHLRDLATDTFTTHLPGHSGRVLLLAFTSDADGLVSLRFDYWVRSWSPVWARKAATRSGRRWIRQSPARIAAAISVKVNAARLARLVARRCAHAPSARFSSGA